MDSPGPGPPGGYDGSGPPGGWLTQEGKWRVAWEFRALRPAGPRRELGLGGRGAGRSLSLVKPVPGRVVGTAGQAQGNTFHPGASERGRLHRTQFIERGLRSKNQAGLGRSGWGPGSEWAQHHAAQSRVTELLILTPAVPGQTQTSGSEPAGGLWAAVSVGADGLGWAGRQSGPLPFPTPAQGSECPVAFLLRHVSFPPPLRSTHMGSSRASLLRVASFTNKSLRGAAVPRLSYSCKKFEQFFSTLILLEQFKNNSVDCRWQRLGTVSRTSCDMKIQVARKYIYLV